MSDVTLAALGLAVAARLPVLLWGGPGVGKTSAVRDLALATGLPLELVIASIREPSDFAGLPVVGPDSSVHFAPPLWAQRLATAGRGILFLDEITTAPPAVQAALLRVVLERTVGDLVLPDDVAIVAAANPADQAADGWDLAPPLANRFCHLTWDLDPRAWVDGFIGGFDALTPPAIDPARWRQEVPRSRATVGSFIAQRPHLLHATPTDPAQAGRAWPSPRSWEMAARLIAAGNSVGATEPLMIELVRSAVGPVAAAEFVGWQADLELPDAEVVLRDPASFRLPPRGDRAFAALTTVTAAVLADNTPERWEAAWYAIAAAVGEDKGDIAIAAIRSLVNHRPDGAVPPRDVLVAMAPVLRTAGLFDRLGGS